MPMTDDAGHCAGSYYLKPHSLFLKWYKLVHFRFPSNFNNCFVTQEDLSFERTYQMYRKIDVPY